MARIRTLKPEFWTSEQVAECSPSTRLLFVGMWSFADDNGIHPASIPRLKMEIFPSDSFTREEIAAMVAELVAAKLLTEYTAEGAVYWQVTGWHRHQKIERPTFKYPVPDGSTNSQIRRHVAEPSPSPRRVVAEPSPPEWNGEEGNGEEEAKPTTPNGVVVADESAPPPLALDGEAKIKPPKPPTPDCPHEEIIAAYHEILPEWAQVGVWNGERQKKLRARWREDRDRQRIDYWRELFGYVRKSDFLMGRVPPKGDRSPFYGDLEFLVTPRYFNRLIEGRYHNG